MLALWQAGVVSMALLAVAVLLAVLSRQRKGVRRFSLLLLEQLEDRRLLATLYWIQFFVMVPRTPNGRISTTGRIARDD